MSPLKLASFVQKTCFLEAEFSDLMGYWRIGFVFSVIRYQLSVNTYEVMVCGFLLWGNWVCLFKLHWYSRIRVWILNCFAKEVRHGEHEEHEEGRILLFCTPSLLRSYSPFAWGELLSSICCRMNFSNMLESGDRYNLPGGRTYRSPFSWGQNVPVPVFRESPFSFLFNCRPYEVVKDTLQQKNTAPLL